MSDYDVIIIGAGCGGLSAGAQLAKQGRKVLVLEQSNIIGGCCSTFEKDGYHFDLGASIIEDAEVINWAFERLGTTLWDEVDLIPCDPAYTVLMQDGTKMTHPLAADAMGKAIAEVAPEDEARWHEFAHYMQGFLDAALGGFFVKPANNIGDMVKMFAETPSLLKYSPLFFSSYQDVIKKFFKSEKMREAYSFHCFYAGLPPELLPGIFAMIPYSEHEGIYYSKGGMIGIPAALKRCGEKFGMEVQLNKLVTKVLVRDGRAIGVKLEDETEITANLIISDINAKQLYLKLIGAEQLPAINRIGIESYEYSMATPTIYLGVDYKPPLESHHTLITRPMDQVNDYWWNSYKKGRFPVEQFGIVSWTSGSDPNLAPDGHHVIIFTLAPGPYQLENTTWDEQKDALMEGIINYYSENYIAGLAEHVKVAEFSTPVDFKRRLRSPSGAIYALRQDIFNETAFRPAARSKCIKNLYLVGASTHPGGGVPTTIASGMIASDLINKYE